MKFKRLRSSEFIRNVMLILTGSVAAQAATILVSPVLTRLYTPSDFGVYALFGAITSLLSSVICARYEFSITLPMEHRKGLALLGVCTLVSFAIGLVLIPVTAIFSTNVADLLNEPRLKPWLWLLPLTMMFTGFTTGARYWLLRTKSFRSISLNGVLRSMLSSAFNVVFGMIGWLQFGLIGGMLIGLFFSTCVLALKIWRESALEIRSMSWTEIRAQAIAQRRFPQYSLGSALVESSASQVPAFFFPSLFGASTLGLFSLAQRIANLPLTLIAQSIADVFRQKASEVYALEGNCLSLFDRTLGKLLLLSVPAFVLVAILSPWAFESVFGVEWRESGEYVRYMMPALALRFVSNPLGSIFYIAQKQACDLVIQVILVLVIVALFVWAGRAGWTARYVIIAYSAVYSIKYLVELCIARRYACGAFVRL
jgi:O-antigen/teichoic acid export membrane protein